MPSQALQLWRTGGAAALDEIEQAHAAVGGTGPGRRYATQQINQAYAVLLSSQFQRMCRDLHTEGAVQLAAPLGSALLRAIVRQNLVAGRRLDRGNPNPGNIGADFERFELKFWDRVRALDHRNGRRQRLLEDLNEWRNAIAHQDFTSPRLGGRTQLRLDRVRTWRSACDALSVAFDRLLGAHLGSILGTNPW